MVEPPDLHVDAEYDDDIDPGLTTMDYDIDNNETVPLIKVMMVDREVFFQCSFEPRV